MECKHYVGTYVSFECECEMGSNWLYDGITTLIVCNLFAAIVAKWPNIGGQNHLHIVFPFMTFISSHLHTDLAVY